MNHLRWVRGSSERIVVKWRNAGSMRRLLTTVAKVATLLLMSVLAGRAAADSRDLDFDLQPLFESKSNPVRVTPYLVTVGNRGPDARGNVVVQGQGFAMRYPIELPRGTQKRLIIYPSEPPYRMGPTNYVLETDQGSLRLEHGTNYEQSSWYALAITDTSGVANFLKHDENYQASITDAYGTPGRLPDRAIGYIGCRVVILGEGAERMSDIEVRALQDYVLMGGNVVLMGGASSPTLRDSRWADWLPVRPERPKTLAARGPGPHGLVPKGSFTLMPGSPTPGSRIVNRYAGEVFVADKRVGFGRVVYLAVNVFEEPVRYWGGLGSMFRGLGVTTGTSEMADRLSFGREVDTGWTRPASYAATPAGAPSLAGDPFQAKMPPTGTILAILAVYFVLVVPVNLLALRKMGRGELAWVTSPIISVVFAAIFFRFAAGLYAAELSTATRGTWVVDEASDRGQFLGSTQMFFPRGGAYDLGLQDVEHIVALLSDEYDMNDRLFNDLRAIDDGTIRAPGMQVKNLSFQEFGFQQRMPGGRLFSVSADGRSVTNRSNALIKNARLIVGDLAYDLGDLEPGATARRSDKGQPAVEWKGKLDKTSNGTRYCVTGDAPTSVRPGPQIGQIVPHYHRIQLVAFGTYGGQE